MASEPSAGGDMGMSGERSGGDTSIKYGGDDYILTLDLGTTTLRAHVFDKMGKCKGSSLRMVSYENKL